MDCPTLTLIIIVPLLGAIATLLAAPRHRPVAAVIAAAVNLIPVLSLAGCARDCAISWAGMDVLFRLDAAAAAMLIATALVALLITGACLAWYRSDAYLASFLPLMLLSVSFANGAFLSDNLTALLFFWQGQLLPLAGMIALARPGGHASAVQALITVGITDLCLVFGAALLEHDAATLTLSQIHVPVEGIGLLAFLLFAVGAVAKAGALPFHSWIAPAAESAPAPFAAFFPAALMRLLGVYLLARMASELFAYTPFSFAGGLLMLAGIATLLWGKLSWLRRTELPGMALRASIAFTGLLIALAGTGLLRMEAIAVIAAIVAVLMTTLTLAADRFRERREGTLIALAARVRAHPLMGSLFSLGDTLSFDPYAAARSAVERTARILYAADRTVNWLFDGLAPLLAFLGSAAVRMLHTGSLSAYILWALAGGAIVILALVK